MWRCFLCDTMTGLLRSEIEIPAFSWTISISDCSFSTETDKGTGEGEVSSITLPWSALPGTTPQARGSNVATGRRGLVLCWEDDTGLVPILFGAIGERTDTYFDTSFSLDSVMTILGNRYCVDDDDFGTATTTDSDGNTITGTSTGYIKFSDMSFRGIASEVGSICTDSKDGGALPIDWTYLDESGSHERTYYAYNVANISGSAIFDKIANVTGGPDMQFRPYMADSQHVRLAFEAGSDADIYLNQDTLVYLSQYNDLTLTHAVPYTKVYETGAGSEEEQICYLAEDLTVNTRDDPCPLMEVYHNVSDDDSLAEVKSAANAYLEAAKVPLCQVTLTTTAEVFPLGHVWPGEVIRVPIDGFPTLPDGDYDMRLMTMSGSENHTITLTFDTFEDPTF